MIAVAPKAQVPRRTIERRSRERRGPRAECLRVALLCPVWFPVPPPRYGGIETVVALLADALSEAGHEVTVFASGDSTTHAKLSWVYAQAPSERLGEPLPELRHVLACNERADEFDVISDHTGPTAAALGQLVSPPVLHTVHDPLDGELGDVYERIARISPHLRLISLSQSQRRPHPSLPWVANCPNAIDPLRFPWSSTRGEYLLFLGRMGSETGCHHAIAVAQACGLPLKIAAKCREPRERKYFAEFVEPHLGSTIEYLGEVGHDQKVKLLLGARVTLFPIEWEEPFGLVMIESLAPAAHPSSPLGAALSPKWSSTDAPASSSTATTNSRRQSPRLIASTQPNAGTPSRNALHRRRLLLHISPPSMQR